MENSMEASQKSKNRTTIWSGNFTSVYTSKRKIQNTNQKKKNTCTAMFIAALFTIAKDMETIKEWNFAICNNTEGLGWYYAKCSKSDRQILYHLYMESKK